APHVSPVHIQDAGPYDRTRFDLVEQFHPLQTASVAKEYLQELRRRIEGVKSFLSEPMLAFSLSGLAFGDWSTWSTWTPCVGGERSRVRSCSAKIPALRIVCHGEAKEVRKCFSTQDQQVPVANDPWTIEREITGDFKS
ncbi:unnamed protein product, partial [Angiostrongylus costaricensis]|uniref:Inositol-pentakisphosphate 2-kinase n=1 Tax=Angiostrongylus costaricensis TaxID=334426 RepID=A0A158PIT5_ANGCS